MNSVWLLRSSGLFIYILSVQTIMATKKDVTNFPPCNTAIMTLFNWCEQSDCTNQCNCRSKSECKQICGLDECKVLNCSSSRNCQQRVLTSEYLIGAPHVKQMVSDSPMAEQDCSQGKCELMKVGRHERKFTRTFQSCSDGNCGHLESEADHTKQFCGNCNKMTCSGKYSKNCTQLCVFGKCEQVYCDAEYCEQLCSWGSTCNLTCSARSKRCLQTCSEGSVCNMTCKAKNCKQVCQNEKSCVKHVERVIHGIRTTVTTIGAKTKNRTSVAVNETVALNDTSVNVTNTVIPLNKSTSLPLATTTIASVTPTIYRKNQTNGEPSHRTKITETITNVTQSFPENKTKASVKTTVNETVNTTVKITVKTTVKTTYTSVSIKDKFSKRVKTTKSSDKPSVTEDKLPETTITTSSSKTYNDFRLILCLSFLLLYFLW